MRRQSAQIKQAADETEHRAREEKHSSTPVIAMKISTENVERKPSEQLRQVQLGGNFPFPIYHKHECIFGNAPDQI